MSASLRFWPDFRFASIRVRVGQVSQREAHPTMIGFRRPVREVGVPTVHRSGPYRYFFWAHENHETREPAHIHVMSDDYHATFWLRPVENRQSCGYTERETARIKRLVVADQTNLLKAWDDFFRE